MATHSGGMRASRLNPFAFPSDTSFRFVLLIVFVVGGTLSLYGELWSVFHSDSDQLLQTAVSKWLAELNQAFNSGNLSDLQSAEDLIEDLAGRVQPLLQDVQIWKLSGVVLTLTLATVIYWLMPTWKIRHEKLQPLSPKDVPEVTACLADLCRKAKLSRVPTFLWNRKELSSPEQVSGAVAFGRLGCYYVRLTGGLVQKFFTDEPAFRAVVLHELAHLRNADVNLTRFTVALWWAFVVTAILPSIALLPWRSINWEAAYLIFMLGIVPTLLVLLTRNAVIRTREFYADVRASVWEGPLGSLRRVLEALPPVKRNRWLRMKLHPDPPERLQTVEDTYRLLRLGFWDAFGAGLAAMIIAQSVPPLLLGLFLTPARHSVYLWSLMVVVGLGVPLFFLSLSVGAVGIGVWRGAFAMLARGQAPHEAGRLGGALALGLLSGILLRNAPLPFIDYLGAPMSGPAAIARNIVLLGSVTALGSAFLFATLFLVFKWVAAAATAWLEVVVYRRSPRPVLTISLVIASASLAVWVSGIAFLMLGLLMYAMFNQVAPPEMPPPGAIFSHIAPLGAVLFATTFALWAFPLAAWLWHRQGTSGPKETWAFLDGEAASLTLPAQAPMRPGVALLFGLAGGLLFCAVWVLLRYNSDVASWLRRLSQSVEGLPTGVIFFSLSAFIQASAAAGAAAWIRRLGALHGLCSASIAGGVISLGWMLVAPYEELNFFILLILGPGTFLALPAALGVSALAGWIRRTSSQSPAEVSSA